MEPTSSRPLAGTLRPEVNRSPVVEKVEELLGRGEYGAAVRFGYRSAFDDTVRSFGLNVPAFRSDRQFLGEFLRPDMGQLMNLLPELYRRYEPVKFGRLDRGDTGTFQDLCQRLYSETALRRIHDPLYQPIGPANLADQPLRPLPTSRLSRPREAP